ncbi:hypothetical protein [Flexithrix dorotheae]|uniref:hypothetical protein n=1 Tax=Flexithrix dorotheae TaxID=70993 RepID=UPI000382CBAE|nr:hypothetical protein [Flexithrix dorotheae]
MKFNSLPLNARKSILFPEATLMSSNENEAFRISFFNFKGGIFEVCYDVTSDEIEDIRSIDDKILDNSMKEFIFS